MNSLQDIWNEIIKILSKELTPTAITTWFSDCEPVDIEDCRLILHTTTDFKRRIIMDRFGKDRMQVCGDLGFKYSTFADWYNGKKYPRIDKIEALASYFGILKSDLIEDKGGALSIDSVAPAITDDVVSFPIVAPVAAGYNHLAVPDAEAEKIDIPRQYLHGRPASDYFALRVIGSSMYPLYQDGDVVLVLKQTTMNRSGEIGVVIYDDESATLKKIEYVMGEDWMRLVPINPSFEPIMVTDEKLEHCRVLGVPRLLIREIEQ